MAAILMAHPHWGMVILHDPLCQLQASFCVS
jgi:hypothetical protein